MWIHSETLTWHDKNVQSINFDDIIKEKIKEHKQNCPQFSDLSYRVLITGGSGSGKTNSLFNLINQWPAIDQLYLYVKDPYEVKYHFLN